MLDRLLRLQSTPIDVAIIGGGIQGAGLAREAALRGLTVALFEKGDFASGTSSRTSGLIHGGIRYLEQGALGLVSEAVHERYLLTRLAPHLVRPIPFLFPIYKGEGRGKLKIRLGMLLYDLLAGGKTVGQHTMLTPKEVLAKEPGLRATGLCGAAEFYDCQMEDARLCLAVILSARESGAAVFNYTEVTRLILKREKVCGVRVKERFTGAQFDIHASVVVNAAGPWADEVCRMEGRAPKRLRPSKGIHIVVPPLTQKHAIVVSPERSRRIFFVIPWKGATLIGTTDTYYTGDLNDLRVEEDEVQWLLRETGRIFPNVRLTPEDVVASYAGVRPLLHRADSPSNDASREGKMEWTSGGMLALLGGKYTLFRKTALQGVAEILKKLSGVSTRKRPSRDPVLYGGEMGAVETYQSGVIPEAKARYPVGDALLVHLINAYGTKYDAVLALAKEDPQLFSPLTPAGFPILAEVHYAVQHEMAVRLSDFMQRRTSLARGPFKSDAALLGQVSQQMGKALGWEPERIEREISEYLEEVHGRRREGSR